MIQGIIIGLILGAVFMYVIMEQVYKDINSKGNYQQEKDEFLECYKLLTDEGGEEMLKSFRSYGEFKQAYDRIKKATRKHRKTIEM